MLLGTSSAAAQMTPDQAAELLLNSARKAYNEKNYPFAETRFREFLAKYGSHKDVPVARYGLALTLVEKPEKDHAGILEQLQPLAGSKEMPEHAFVLYYLGYAHRGLGVRELAVAAAKPPEASQRRAAANQRFEEAARFFGAAIPVFGARAKEPAADAKDLPIDLEWAIRSRCDQAEMQLRILKAKEAQATTAPFLKDRLLAKSRYYGLGLYYHGFASFLIQEYAVAGRTLNQGLSSPMPDPAFALHARYLLARIHHQDDELAEAGRHYEEVIADYGKQKLAAVQALKQPAKFKNDPDERSRLEALVKEPAPDYVARSAFYSGVLLYEGGKFGEALARFAAFPQQYAGSPLLTEAQLRQGFCLVQLKQFAEEDKVLRPLLEKEGRLQDQVLFWLGKAQAGAADPANPAAQEQALKAALDSFRRSAERSQQMMANDPEARIRRGETLLELGDTQQLARQYKEAASTYEQILSEKVLPGRDEEVLQRQVAALHLSGDYGRADQASQKFQQAYPKSLLLPAVLFRYAENAYFSVLAAEKNPNAGDRAKETARWTEEALKRYRDLIGKYPEFAQVNVARFGVGMLLYRRGDYEKAKEALEAIPAPERQGDLAVTPYLLADCLMRLAPTKVDDALAAGQLQEQLKAAVQLLDGFIGGQPGGPQTPDAMLKLGLCHQRLAVLLAQPQERAATLNTARTIYDALAKQFPKHPLVPQAALERARCLALAGNKPEAVNSLRRFTEDPLRQTSAAPMALLQLANLLREQNKADEAVKVLASCREQYEQGLLKDAERGGWVPLLQYHHGVALREAGKLPEARGVFDQVMKQFGGRPEAIEASLRWGQCLQQEGQQKLEAAQKRLATSGLKPEETEAAAKLLAEGREVVKNAVQHFESQAAQLKEKQPTAEARARMLYEAAWGYRTLAEPEVGAERLRIQQERLKKLQDELAKKSPTGQPPAALRVPGVPLAQVPVQPSEQKARAMYQALIEGFADVTLATEARFELAELRADRNEFDAALKLLNDALDKEPPAELTDRIRIRMGACHLGRKDPKAALAQFDAVAQNPKSTMLAQAHYRAGECLIEMEDFAKAATRLAVFRDQPNFHNVPGVSDRALLRLGLALGRQGQWDGSRQAYEALTGRFPGSPWIHEARYGIGWAFQNLKQYDQAIAAYGQVAAATATELGARAQLQIGLCRLDQKRLPDAATALLVVPTTYDYPELSAAALCEAARTLAELKQKDQAERMLQRVLRDHPSSKWAEVAKERLEALQKGS